MKAILIEKPGDEGVLKPGEFPDPVCGPSDLLIKVKYAALNRADLMQRQGFYPPPPGASPILGMECAGEVAEVGASTDGGSAIARWRCCRAAATRKKPSRITAPRCMFRPR
jgi:NADPH:quinone reductase-like Zn-dependent oxidoreductase